MIISSICSEYSCFSLTTVVIYIVENLGSIFRIDVFHSFLLCIIYSAHQILQNHAELFEMNIFFILEKYKFLIDSISPKIQIEQSNKR